MAKPDVDTMFQAQPLIGTKYNDVLAPPDTIPPGKTIDRMAEASFEAPESAVEVRKAMILHLEDVDGAAFDITRKKITMITTQVLDTARGAPAARIPVQLDIFITGQGWHEVGHGVTSGRRPRAGFWRASDGRRLPPHVRCSGVHAAFFLSLHRDYL